MDPAGLERLAFFAGLPRWDLEVLAGAAREEELPAGRTVLHQHDRVRTVHLLVDGALQILVRVGDDDLLVGVLSGPGSWSAGRPSGRPTARRPRCAASGRAGWWRCRWRPLRSCSPATPLGYLLLGRVAAGVADRLEQARDLLLAAATQGR